MFNNLFFPENRVIYEIMSKKDDEARQTADGNKRHVACWISKATRAQTHEHVLALALKYTRWFKYDRDKL
jgi:hypothetical protein